MGSLLFFGFFLGCFGFCFAALFFLTTLLFELGSTLALLFERLLATHFCGHLEVFAFFGELLQMLSYRFINLLWRFALLLEVMMQHHTKLAENAAHRIAGLCAVVQPVQHPLLINFIGGGLLQWVVAAQVLNVPPVSRVARIGCDNGEHRNLFAP